MARQINKQVLRSFLRHRGIRNSIWIVSEKIYQMTINLLLTTVTSRYLGPANYGVLNYGATLVSFFSVIMKLGLDSIMTNELIKHRDQEGRILGTSIYLRFLSSILSLVAMAILVFILQNQSPLIMITSIIQSFSLIIQANGVIDYWFQSHLKSKYVSIAKAIAYSIMALYKIWLLVTSKSVVWFAFANLLDYLIIAVFLLAFYHRQGGAKMSIDRQLGKTLLRGSYHFIISGIMVLIYTQIDKIMIGQMMDEYSLGLYSAALAICTLCTFVPEAILASARTTVFNAKNKQDKYLRRLKQTYAVIFWICSAMALVTTIFAPLLVQVIYGEDYISCVPTLQILVWYVPLSQLGLARGIWIVSESKNRYTRRYTSWGTIANIGLNFAMIPAFGISGAALATVITEVFTCFITPLFYKETRIHTKYVLQALMFNFRES